MMKKNFINRGFQSSKNRIDIGKNEKPGPK